ncbi:hypothetical protein GCM10009765_58080 [Fodinicola feengrottensis]|uniref:Uncharacterized protein n=1 Tax=Fodinicola feengrottensis TaxID=435914 RepID=A0ABN2I9J5_9ACTN
MAQPGNVAALTPGGGSVQQDAAAGVVAELVAYSLLNHAAQQIAEGVAAVPPWRVLVVEDRTLAATDWSYHAVTEQMGRLSAELKAASEKVAEASAPPKQLPSPSSTASVHPGQEGLLAEVAAAATAALGVANAVPAVVGAIADTIGYLRTDYTITGRAFTVKSTALVTAVARALRQQGVRSEVDGFHTFPATTASLAAFSDFQHLQRDLTVSRLTFVQQKLSPAIAEVAKGNTALMAAQAEVTAARAAQPPDQVREKLAEAAAEEAADRLSRAQQAQTLAQQVADLAAASLTRASTFETTVTTVPAGGGLPPLAVAATLERLHASGDNAITHVLYVGVDVAGGETVVKKRFLGAPGIRYIGSCQVSAMLVGNDGDVAWARTMTLVGQLKYSPGKGKFATPEMVEVKMNDQSR